MKYEYKSLDFYTDSEEEGVQNKIKNDIKAMFELGWSTVFSIKLRNCTTLFFRKQLPQTE